MTPTSLRVERHTDPEVNRKLRSAADLEVARSEGISDDAIAERIQQLEAEWDIERVLQTNASIVSGTGLLLGLTVDRRFLLLSTAVFSFLCQHAIQGWCPPLPILRRLGVRTQGEIDREKFALKAIRGDFQAVERYQTGDPNLRVSAALNAVDM